MSRTPKEIAANLNPDVRAALLEAEGERQTLPEPEAMERLVGLKLFGPTELSFVYEVTDLGRQVAAEVKGFDHE